MRNCICIALVVFAGLVFACAERTAEENEQDVEAQAACATRCERLELCGIEDEIGGDEDECKHACLEDNPWVWSDCRRESLELFACTADLTCEELRITEGEEQPPDPIEDRPCNEELEAYSTCFTSLDT